FEVLGPEIGSVFRHRMTMASQSEDDLSFIDKFTLPIGERWFLSTLSRVEGPDGAPGAVQIIATDITERKVAEEAIRSSEERFRLAMEASRDGIWDWNVVTDEAFFSPGYSAMLGYPVGSMIRHMDSWKSLIHPEDRTAVLKRCDDCTRGLTEEFEAEYRMQARDGSWRWILGRGLAASRDERGRATRVVGTHTDITERKRIEDALKTSEKWFRMTVEASPIGVGIVDREGNMLDFNTALQEMIGYSREEMLGMNFRQFTHPDDIEPEWKLVNELWAGKRDKYREEKRYIHKDGHVFWGEIAVSLFRGGAGESSFAFGYTQDISGRKQAEEALRLSEERFQLAMEASRDGIWDWDIVADRLHVSPGYESMIGYTEEEIDWDFATWKSKIHPEDRAATVVKPEKCLNGEIDSFEVEYRFRAKDGSWRWILGRGKAVARDKSGRATRMVGTHTDVTDRRVAEIALREREELFRSIFQHAYDGIILADAESKELVMANEVACQMLGYDDTAELTELSVTDIHPESHIDYVLAEFEKQRQREKRIVKQPMLRVDGSVFYADVSASPLMLGDREYMMGIFRDMTERNQLEDELQELRVLHESVLATVPQAVGLFALDGTLIWANQKMKDLARRMCEKVAEPLTLADIFPSTEFPNNLSAGSDDNSAHDMPLWSAYTSEKTTDGQDLFFRLSLTPVDPSNTSKGIVCTATDVTEQVQAQRREEEQRVHLMKMDRLTSVGRLAAGVAHEINNPLAVLYGQLQELAASPDSYRPEMVNMMLKVSGRIREIVQSLLQFSHQGDDDPHPCDLNSLIKETLSLLSAELSKRGIETTLNLVEDPPVAMANQQQIQQVFINIIMNAIDAMPNGGNLTVKSARDGDQFSISFEDTGPGIDPQHLSDVFTPFFTTKEVGHGTGLGLSISYGIITAHGGEITATNESERGAAFVITLPTRPHTQSAQTESKSNSL
ncbi:PAS domain S-box protein, partial [candidate division GN15 bacterium]|nr:PAS domain S-box protein [candidate division GN15 bacterium]